MSIDVVNDITPRVQYVAAAGQVDFAYPFPIFADGDLVVDVDGTTQTLTTDYTVSGAGDDAGGTVTFGTAPGENAIVTIYRDIALERLTDFAQNGDLSSAAFNDEFDRLTLADQELKAKIERCVRIPMTAEVDSDDIELAVANWANKYLTFDADGRPTPATLAASTMTQATIGVLLNPRTQAEISGALTPNNYHFEGADIRRYTDYTDGSADITAVLEGVNAVWNTIVFPPGTTINCQNWVPLAGTKIIAYGATVRRHGDTTHGATGSSAAIVASNNDIEVFGGEWIDGPSATQATWSGSILIDGGNNFRIRHAEIRDTWGAIFGNETQNGTNLAEGVSIVDCWLHDNQHNTYLADIDGLLVRGCLSELSDRDGLKTYRNVRNVAVLHNCFRNNGDATVGQSRDGIDLFIAGYRCIIAGNLIYGNAVKGVDIKRNSTGDPETYENHQIIVSDNLIASNDDAGVEIEVAGGVGYCDYINLHDNIITANGNRGVKVDYLRYSRLAGNLIFGNTGDGLRHDNGVDTMIVHNTVVDNTAAGINNVSGTAFITQNKVISTGTQTTGIVVGSGICRDNDVSGHATQYSLSGTLPAKGKILTAAITNTTDTQLLAIAEKGAISGIEILLNNTEASMDVTFSKRNASTGAFSANICANTGVAFATAYVVGSQTVTGTNSQRNVAGGEALTLALANITSGAFTAGLAKIHYVD